MTIMVKAGEDKIKKSCTPNRNIGKSAEKKKNKIVQSMP